MNTSFFKDFKSLATTAIIAIVCLAGASWAKQEPMSTKSAMQYFTDEGLTIGINMGNSLDAVKNWDVKDWTGPGIPNKKKEK